MANECKNIEGYQDRLYCLAVTYGLQPRDNNKGEVWFLDGGREMYTIANRADNSNCLIIFDPNS